jgi:NAD(P)H-quinone oxidoreductase subunit N
VGRGAAVGEVQRVMPLLGADLEGKAPILLWLLEGQVLSNAELASLLAITRREPRFKLVVELGGARELRWQPLSQVLQG